MEVPGMWGLGWCQAGSQGLLTASRTPPTPRLPPAAAANSLSSWNHTGSSGLRDLWPLHGGVCGEKRGEHLCHGEMETH